MISQQQSYRGNFAYPQPIIFNDEHNFLTIIAIPWGGADIAEQGIQVFSDYYLSTLDDVETTTPFETFTCLSDVLNNLRIATLLTNDHIYRQHNHSDFRGAMELLAITQIDNTISWVKIGGPNIFLHQGKKNLLPLSVSFNLQDEANSCPSPLPKKLLGTERHCNMLLDDFSLKKEDSLILITKNNLPSDFYSFPLTEKNLPQLSSTIAKEDSDQPFWIGLYNPKSKITGN